jgi:hypothetical protein
MAPADSRLDKKTGWTSTESEKTLGLVVLDREMQEFKTRLLEDLGSIQGTMFLLGDETIREHRMTGV